MAVEHFAEIFFAPGGLIHSRKFKKKDADRNPRIIREHRMSP
jgi:hypothetical protein